MTDTNDDDAMWTLDEAMEATGLVRAELLRAIREGELPATYKQRVGYRVKRGPTRAHAAKIFEAGAGKRPPNVTTKEG